MNPISYVLGYLKGYFAGRRSGKNFVNLMAQYGGLEYIPTRELYAQLGPSAETMVVRQRLKVAVLALSHLTETYCQKPIPWTMNEVADFLEFEATSARFETIVNSNSVLHGLAAYAEDVDGLSVTTLLEMMERAGVEHQWHLFKDNRLLRVN